MLPRTFLRFVYVELLAAPILTLPMVKAMASLLADLTPSCTNCGGTNSTLAVVSTVPAPLTWQIPAASTLT